jgi:HAD superfamily hydrolase (TIGR01459 family)
VAGTPVARSPAELVAGYDGVLLDAYGVLLDKRGALPGAAALLAHLEAAEKPWLVLTNSASRLPETFSAELGEAGLAVPPERIQSSGMLVADWFAAQGLGGARSLVLGPADAVEYVRRAGGVVVDGEGEADVEVIVIADQKGFDCLPGMDQALSLLLRRLDRGLPMRVLVCNPDLIYPVAPGQYGFTAGALAAMLEAVIRERYPEWTPPLVRLGKPHAPIFEAARRRLPGRLLMIGDQLATDILGANRAGIDSALVGTGLCRGLDHAAIRPTWFLPSLEERALVRK